MYAIFKIFFFGFKMIIKHFYMFIFNFINLTFIFSSLLIFKVVDFHIIRITKISFSIIRWFKSSCHNIASSCDLPTLYHEGMIKSNPTKGGMNDNYRDIYI